jgi:hypothetical protein
MQHVMRTQVLSSKSSGQVSWGQSLRRLAAGCVIAISLLSAVGTTARADQYVTQANSEYAKVRSDQRSDTVILPVLHKMQAVPEGVRDAIPAALMTKESSRWAAVKAWCEAKPQQDAIEALKKVTNEQDSRRAFAFAQPYGSAAVDPEFIEMGLYTELGEPPTLAAADFKYLGAIKNLEILCHLEATRLMAEGKATDALDLVRRWAYFARSMSDREFLAEKTAGMNMLGLAITRMRDIVYVDAIGGTPTITPATLRTTVAALDEQRTVIAIDRIRLPSADRLASEQLVSRTFAGDGPANAEVFSRTFAAARSVGRPARRFSESAKWDSLSALHADGKATNQQIRGLFDDWQKRWQLPTGNSIHQTQTDYVKLDKVRFSSIDAVMGDLGVLLPLRQQLRAEAVGTRTALAIQAFATQQKAPPPALESIVPTYLANPAMLTDPYDKAARESAARRVGYFVPERAGVAAGGKPTIHEVRVFPKVTGVTYNNFVAPVRGNTFVLYAAGPDGNLNGATLATQAVEDAKGDYLIWPPVLSLLRQNLSETGQLP